MALQRPALVTADLEGVFIPEIWISVAGATGIEPLRLTTRDIADYDKLMAYRMEILRQHGLTLADIQGVIATMAPLSDAVAFIDWIRARAPFIILTDSFYDFVEPFIPKLGCPTIFAHRLVTDADGMIAGYALRHEESKRQAIDAFRDLGFRTLSFGDSYNDTSMLSAADRGVLFRPPANVAEQFPQFPVTADYDELRLHIDSFLADRWDLP